MSWLVVTWFLAFGYVPVQYESVYMPKIELDSGLVATVAQIGLNAEIAKRFNVFGDMENFQYFNAEKFYDGSAFNPYRIDYTFGVSFDFNEYVSIIANHECDHVIKRGRQEDGYESTETKVIVKIRGISTF